MLKAYIDRINVFGFKSYGERYLSIPLGEGFTAIVGPNGSGKSNLGDAIVFCLGIASAKAMRAIKLTDLIFSSKGKTAPYAEVEIIFKNNGAFPLNTEEVSISRKVDLSGKSTYKINSRPAKQQEVEELLTLAEIPTQGYNIVTQGDIYKFVKMTPSERRDLISDIAGITQYEERKQKALQDLNQSNEKIEKVKAVLNEISHTLKKLEKEKEDALLAIDLENQIQQLQNAIKSAKLYLLLKQKEEVLNQITQVEDQINNLYLEKEKNIENQKEIINNIKQLEEKLNHIQESFLPIKEREGSITAHVKSLSEKKDDLEKTLQQLQEKLKALEKEKEEKIKEILQTEETIKNLSSQLPKLLEELKEAEKTLEEKNKQLQEIEFLGSSAKNDLGEIEKQEKQLLETIKQLENEKTQYQIKLNTTQEKINNLNQDLAKTKEEIENLEKTIENIKLNTKDTQTQIQGLQSEITRLKVRKETLEKRLKETREKLEKNFQKLAHILAQLSQFREDKTSIILKSVPGVYGQVSELISLKDPMYQTAIEVAGGGRLKNIVVEDDYVAQKCIDILKKEKSGRVTFIPLNKIKVFDNPKLPFKKGLLGYAIDFVDYDKKIEKAIKYVFQDTVVVEDFESARSIGIGSYRMVTLEGELFEKSGAISGGFERQNITIGRSNLEAEKQKLEEEDEKLKKEEESIQNELKLINNKIAENEKTLIKIQTETSSINQRIQELTNQLISKNNKVSYLENEIFNLKKQSLEYEGKIEKLQQEIEKQSQTLQSVSNQKQERLKRLERAGLSTLRKQWEEAANRVYSLKEKVKDIETQINLLIDKKDNQLKIRVFQIETEKEEIRNQLYQINQEIESVKSKIESLTKELSDLWKDLKTSEKERDDLINQIQDLREKVKNLRYEEENINKEITILLQEKAKLQQKLTDTEEEILMLKQEYDGEPVEADIKSLEKQLKTLEEKRKNLGSVNQKALEDYEEELKRYNEINEKLTILIQEKKSIEELIENLEEKKLQAFMEVYENINKNLDKNFKILSPGGKAYLELENPSDPLSGGVLLKARPRGKDVKRLEMMSGGEKTLTALAFLFAVQQYRPAPFYYFDEVDAALDDANAKKVGQLIKQLSSQAQFIVVTHRDAMASFADRLIGVSAKEGISHIYTLDVNSLRESGELDAVGG
ncbi:chromosome segregation protein SMC [Sulfurihydrogenibium azorense]|uniref:chromosome segregation protein SMC n=1 Tax=Sulfurihydrogenibium azorense TaxID=309806 RepID=UPI0024092892|nr:chromosome segregation protein SMC [Sulfurihydrogenibium azorense]MDM7273712.1 chromosome segregation protein SMC [Sulfurihydrogenibium azorense]